MCYFEIKLVERLWPPAGYLLQRQVQATGGHAVAATNEHAGFSVSSYTALGFLLLSDAPLNTAPSQVASQGF